MGAGAGAQDMNYRLQPTFVTLTWRSAFKDEVREADEWRRPKCAPVGC